MKKTVLISVASTLAVVLVIGLIIWFVIGASNKPKDWREELDGSKALTLYVYQLIVNFLWPTFFFNLQWYLFSFFWLLLLWILVLAMIISFYRISKPAAYLQIPYLVWLTFAGYLNLGIWILNR